MQSWSEGYVSEVGYTYGLFNELNPLRLKLAFALAGLVAPEIETACELGFGQGLSIVLHGAATDVEWHGNDFAPAQAGFAQELAGQAGARIHLTDQSFADFCARPDLPDFDFVGLHGIWSWVSQANRDIIVDFLARKLKVGGVLYLSYNAQPGWSAAGPLRHLLFLHDALLGAPGKGVNARVEEAMAFVQKLFDTNPLYVQQMPSILERFRLLGSQSRQYLAHEFFNQNWQPFYVSEIAQALAPAKLDFACSANLLDAVDALNLSDEHQDMLETVADPLLRETVRDVMVNASFRKDYWVKGARRLNDLDHGAIVRGIEVVLMTTPGEVPKKVMGGRGEADLTPEIYEPLLARLGDHQPHSIGELDAALPDLRLSTIVQSVAILASMGVLSVAITPTDETRRTAHRVNMAICRQARGSEDIAFLASPVTGSGVPATRFHQLFILARAEGQKAPADWARFAWSLMASQNQLLVRDGRKLQTAEENIAVLTEMAENFARGRLRMLEALQVV